jgi:hypothetical protein
MIGGAPVRWILHLGQNEIVGNPVETTRRKHDIVHVGRRRPPAVPGKNSISLLGDDARRNERWIRNRQLHFDVRKALLEFTHHGLVAFDAVHRQGERLALRLGNRIGPFPLPIRLCRCAIRQKYRDEQPQQERVDHVLSRAFFDLVELSAVMPGLWAGHPRLSTERKKDVDGRDGTRP